MRKIIDILFAFVTSVVLLSLVIYQGYIAIVPGVSNPDKSKIEARTIVKVDDLLKTSFADGGFQDKFEEFASDHVPSKETWILANSALQRQGIKTAAGAFGYDLFPTFYGSSALYSTDYEKMFWYPRTKWSTSELDDLISVINKSVDKHSDKNYLVNVVVGTYQSENNPAYSMLNHDNRVDTAWAAEHWLPNLDNRVMSEIDDCGGRDEIQDLWYNSDSHWTLERALQTYNRIADKLSLKHVEYNQDEAVKVISGWRGTYARQGANTEVWDDIYDLPTDYSNLVFYHLDERVKKGKKFKLGKREKILSGKLSADSLSIFDGYGEYYGAARCLIKNKGENNGKTCLLIGDSYTHCLKRVIADNYERTIAILPGNAKITQSLEYVINKFDPDDVIFILHCQKYVQIKSTSPAFLEGE